MASLRDRRVAIVTRIFAPEPGAASLRLNALAHALRSVGTTPIVFTTTPPPGIAVDPTSETGMVVTRFPVLRDRAGYVRGYLQYLSFDIPAFFRVLFARRIDTLIVEPPPTTGFAMRLAAGLRRIPYYFYAADIWSEAAAVAQAPSLVVAAVRRLERFVYRGATAVLAVSESVADRVRTACPSAKVIVVGNGYDDDVFTHDGTVRDWEAAYLVYAGTASEVHGAHIFVEALPAVLEKVDGHVVFLGQGADRDRIEELANRIAPGRVHMLPRCSPAEAAEWLRGANASLASMAPDGYAAFPTKMYASIGCGTPVIFAGEGEGRQFMETGPALGWCVDYDPKAVATAMIDALRHCPTARSRAERATWAKTGHSLKASAGRIVNELIE